MADDLNDNDQSPLRIERETKTLRQLALERMREAILRFHFQPGERLVERQLCDQLGISRSVVREVLRHLEAEGLVENIPQQGPAVASFDPGKVEQIYEIRAMLEALAAGACAKSSDGEMVECLRGAIRRIDEAFNDNDAPVILDATTIFYEQLFGCSGKTVAWEIVQSLNARINHLRAMTITSPGRHAQAIQEMRRIVDAVENQDEHAATEAAREHIRVVASLAHDFIGQS